MKDIVNTSWLVFSLSMLVYLIWRELRYPGLKWNNFETLGFTLVLAGLAGSLLAHPLSALVVQVPPEIAAVIVWEVFWLLVGLSAFRALEYLFRTLDRYFGVVEKPFFPLPVAGGVLLVGSGLAKEFHLVLGVAVVFVLITFFSNSLERDKPLDLD